MIKKETESITNRINDIERIHLLVEGEIGPECAHESLMSYTREKIPAIDEKIATNTVDITSIQEEAKRKNKNFTKMINDNSKILKEN